jgi:DNA-directed RNA polymerase subunit H
MAKTDTTKHLLVPKHTKISEKEKKELFEKFNISSNELPKINKKDPGISNLDVKVGDVIKITRKSHTAEEAFFYRSVTNV